MAVAIFANALLAAVVFLVVVGTHAWTIRTSAPARARSARRLWPALPVRLRSARTDQLAGGSFSRIDTD